MAVELSTETLTEEGGADGAEREREGQNRLNCVELHSLVAIVVATAISS